MTHASLSDALEALALGETFDLVALEAESPRAEGFRAELRHLAPSMLERAFALSSSLHRADALARMVGTNDAARGLGARAGHPPPEAQGERRIGAPGPKLQPAVRPERENRSSRARRAGP